MRTKGEIEQEINKKSAEKEIIDRKIEKLSRILPELSYQIMIMGQNGYKIEDLKPAYDGMISADDYSFGTLRDYYVETAGVKKDEYMEIVDIETEWISKDNKEYARAEEKYMEWTKMSKVLKDEIDALIEEYQNAPY